MSDVAETWWDAGGIFACPDTESLSARCQNREGHSALAIHSTEFVHVLVLLAAGLALCYLLASYGRLKLFRTLFRTFCVSDASFGRLWYGNLKKRAENPIPRTLCSPRKIATSALSVLGYLVHFDPKKLQEVPKTSKGTSQVKLILSPKQRAKPAASRTRTCTNAAVCIASGECPSRF